MEASPPAPEEPGSSGFRSVILRGAGIVAGGFVVAQALNLAIYIVLSRLITPAEFGVYAAATVLVGFGILLTESGMQAALIHQKDRLDEALNTGFVATIAGGFLSVLVALATAPLLGAIFDDSQVTELAIATSGFVWLNVIQVAPNSVIQRRFQVARRAVIDPFEVVCFGIAVIIAAANGMGPWALVIGQYVYLLSGAVLAWILAKWRPRPSLASFAMWRELARYGRHVLLSTTIVKTSEQSIDTLVIGKGISTAALGQFRYAYRIATLPYQVLLAGVGYVLFPAMARIRDEPDRLRAAFLRSLRWLATLGFPAGFILVPLGPGLASQVFGDVWEPAGYAAAAMCFYTGASCIITAVIEMLKGAGQVRPLVPIFSVSAVVMIGSMIALAPFGLTAAAVGLSLGPLAGAAYAMRAAGRAVDLRFAEMWHQVWPPALAALIMALAILPLDRFVLDPGQLSVVPGLLVLGGEAVACLVVFAAAMHLLSPASISEIVRMVRDRIKGDDADADELLSEGEPA